MYTTVELFYKVWAGWHEVFAENDWRHSVNHETRLSNQTFKPWSIGEPNGGERENCAVVNVKSKTWDDVTCERKECGVFSLPNYVEFRMRGLCEDSLFDFMYGFISKDDEEMFVGFRNSLLRQNINTNEWKLTLRGNSKTFASLKKESPIGFNKWQIENDRCNGTNFSNEAMLNFNSCKYHEFFCTDGSWYK